VKLPPDAVVFVVDDDPSVREALQAMLETVGVRCEAFASASDFLLAPRPDAPSCLVLDVNLREGSGLDLAAKMSRAGDTIPTVFITGAGTIPMTVRAMKGGAVEFLPKPFSDEDLLGAIAQALERDQRSRESRSERRALSERFATLTPRERDVLELVVAGRMNKEIAAQLGTAEQTVKQHRGRVMQKLGVRSVADLVRLVERNQPLPPTKV
jgi:RNA polymerase sigma factor (sigma-70 family)